MSRTVALALVLLALVGAVPARAQAPASARAVVDEAPDAIATALETMRAELRALRFEAAIDAASALLEDATLSADARVEALRVRIAANVSLGQSSAVEADLRRVLALAPGYEPDPTTTPKRTLERFRALRDSLVGRLRLVVDPAGATVTIDDGAALAPDEALPVLAGRHTVRVTHPGFDADVRLVEVEAGRESELKIELAQNARTLRVETVEGGVEVRLDGVAVGRTSRSAPGVAASLELEWLALGDHRLELGKPCHRTERRDLLLTVDLLDRGPFRLGPIDLLEVRSTLRPTGGPPGARVRLDDEPAGTLPLERLELCPGPHTVEIRVGERVAWSETIVVTEAEDRALPIEPRPNVVVLGAESLGGPLAALDGRVSLRVRPAAERPRGDPADPASWRALDPARDTDLMALRSPTRGGADRWFVYSPWLDRALELDATPVRWSRPTWRSPVWGVKLADSRVGGVALVVHVDAAGAARTTGLRAGDRVVELGGVAVESAAQVRALLSAASPRAPLEIRWSRPGADGAALEMRGALSGQSDAALRAAADGATGVDAMLFAAFAAVDAACDPAAADDARANLALALSEAGRHEPASRLWRQVGWPARSGVGAGTAAYYLGRDLEALGRPAEAAEAYRRAAESAGTAPDGSGLPVGPAGRDRLFDLGLAGGSD